MSAARLKLSFAGPLTAPSDKVPGQEAVCRAVHAFGRGGAPKRAPYLCKLRSSIARSGTHSVLGPWARTRQGRGHGRNSSALACLLVLGSLRAVPPWAGGAAFSVRTRNLEARAGVPTELIFKEFK